MTGKRIDIALDLTGKVAVVTGGAGILCAAVCQALAGQGASVVIGDLNQEAAQALADKIVSAGGEALGLGCDVLDKRSLSDTADRIRSKYSQVDILINGAGGNKPQATTSVDQPFFDLPADVLRWVFDLNLLGTILPSQVFGRMMAEQKSGSILNISSMNAFRPLTRIPAYSAAKAGVSNFTQWLAVHMAQEYSPSIRVNAIAPGFFLTEQNRFLLHDTKSGELTTRGSTILAHTPLGRFGVPEDLLGAVIWLSSTAASFVTGVVLPIDGGFSAFSGV